MKEISEDILMKALELQESGQTPEDIFAAFPKEAEELKEYFNLASELRAEGAKIEPPSREFLKGALRRAAASGGVPEMAVQPARARFFNLLPFGLRLAAPALAVLLIVAFVDGSKVAAPGPELSPGDQVAIEDSQATGLAQDSGNAAPVAFMTASPAPTAPAAPVAMKSAPAQEPATPSDAADQIAQAYMDNADGEEAVLSDTSAEEQAAEEEGQSVQYVAEPTN